MDRACARRLHFTHAWFWVCRTVDVDFRVAFTADKLKNLGWKPRSLEETLVDGLEFLEKAGLLREPCRLPYFYRMNAEE